MKVRIFTEDRYAPGFINELIKRLKNEGYLNPNIQTKTSPINKYNYRKVNEKIKASITDYDKIILLIDYECKKYTNPEDIIRQYTKDIKNKEKITVIFTEPEIEEWICISLGYKFDKNGFTKYKKPSKILKEKIGYEKSNLHKYVKDLNINLLLENSRSFKEFLEALK